MVPIVLGTTREDYMGLAPPNSYIHVVDFPTIKALTDYLLYLDKTDTAYATFFAWKQEGLIVVSVCFALNWKLSNSFIYSSVILLGYQEPLISRDFKSLLDSFF